jgi:hypothetical protein
VCTRDVATVATPGTPPRWLEYARIEGALANLRYHMDTILAYNVLHDHHLELHTTTHDGDELGAVSEAALGGLRRDDSCTAEVATGHSLIRIIALELVLSRQGGAVARQERLGGLLSSSHMTDMQGDAQQCFASIRLFPPSLM